MCVGGGGGGETNRTFVPTATLLRQGKIVKKLQAAENLKQQSTSINLGIWPCGLLEIRPALEKCHESILYMNYNAQVYLMITAFSD